MLDAGDDAPAPGEGPSQEERENGACELRFVGEDGEERLRTHAGMTFETLR